MMKNYPFSTSHLGLILWLLVAGCGFQAVTGNNASISEKAIVRIVVNTVVSSGNGDNNAQAPIVINPASQTVNALSFPGGGQHIRPSSSRPEKRKADGSLFFPDGNVVDQGTTQLTTHETAYNGNGQTEEANVRIAGYATGQPQATLPTGLVTMMGGTVVQGGQTTIHETKVIGTYIDGTYAQILQSTSNIFENDKKTLTATATTITAVKDSSSVQSTSVTSQSTPTKITISPTPTSSGKWPHLKSRPPYTGVIRSSRSKNIEDKNRKSRELSATTSIKPPRRNTKSAIPRSRSNRKSSTTQLKTITPTASQVSDGPKTVIPSMPLSNKKNSRKNRNRSTVHAKATGRNRFEKNNVRPTINVPKFTYTPNPNKYYLGRRRSKPLGKMNEQSNKNEQSMEARTIEMTSSTNVILSTIMTTVTTEITQFFGGKENSNSLVFTTTYEQPIVLTISKSNTIVDVPPSKPVEQVTSSAVNVKFLDEDSMENENIFNPFLEEALEDEVVSPEFSFATPPLPTVNATTSISLKTTTDDVTTTEIVLQTSFLPILDGSTTAIFTLTQSFFVTKIIHALRTVPPPEMMSLVISQDLNVAESEHREDSVYPDMDSLLNNTNSDIFNLFNMTENDVTQPNSPPTPPTQPPTQPPPPPPMPPQPPLQQYNNPFLNPFINPFAYLGYGAGVPPVVNGQPITTSSAVYSTETIYGTKVLPIWDGLSTSYHTTKAPSSTKIHTSYETYTTQGAAVPNPVMPFPPVNNFGPMQTITTPITTITTETLTSTQVLKLMYDGYKTSFRTLLSTTETVKTVTTQATTTVPYGQMQPFFG